MSVRCFGDVIPHFIMVSVVVDPQLNTEKVFTLGTWLCFDLIPRSLLTFDSIISLFNCARRADLH